MDRFQHAASSLDELKQIQFEARNSDSLRTLRGYFERVQDLRRIHASDFDIQLLVAEVQDRIIQRARDLRSQNLPDELADAGGRSWDDLQAGVRPEPPPEFPSDAAEIPPEVPRIDQKSWQRATFMALFLTALICVAFFYLIQTARRNFFGSPTGTAAAQKAATSKPGATSTPATPTAQVANPSTPTAPTLRLYTDLVPGTVSIDDGERQDLKDGELILDHLETGRHSINVAGRSGSASFSFDVDGNSAPQVFGQPTATNAIAVLVSAQDGKGRLLSSMQDAPVSLDTKAAGQTGPDGLALADLGTTDHEIQLGDGKDRQRFVLTYTAAPVLTVYVKSDPNAGTVVVTTKEDGATILVNGKPYRRKTDHGSARVGLAVGTYSISLHKDGFSDPPPQTVTVKKSEESALVFNLQPLPDIAQLEVKGAAPGTSVLVDKIVVGTVGPAGAMQIPNIKSGGHTIELRLDGSIPKRFERTFEAGQMVSLGGSDAQLDKQPAAETTAAAPAPAPAETTTAAPAAAASGANLPGARVQRGGGFVPYVTPRSAGHYGFQARGKVGGFLKHGKLQWYAGYENSENFVLFVVDGKHATIREMRDGKTTEVSRIPFNVSSDEWVQVDLSIKPAAVSARVRTPDSAWSDVGSVPSTGQDFTKGKVGFYVPGNDEVAVSNFHFSGHE